MRALSPFPRIGESEPIEVITWLIIDTNRYSGNFERQMCAFITGRYGDCEVGKEEAERVLADVGSTLDWTEEAITQTADENGVHRPVRIEQTPGWVQDHDGNHYPEDQVPVGVEPFQHAYQSVGISFGRALSKEELQQLMHRAELFPSDESYLEFGVNESLEILGYRVMEERVTRAYTAAYAVTGKARDA